MWESSHEKALNCIDETTPSRLLVTSRIRGLVQGCSEVSLDVMGSEEAVDLLLRTGGVDDPSPDEIVPGEGTYGKVRHQNDEEDELDSELIAGKWVKKKGVKKRKAASTKTKAK